MARKFVLMAFIYAIAGMALGIYMGVSQNHSQLVAHAHIMLVGFVVPVIYAVCHQLWLDVGHLKMAQWQFYLHQIAVLVFVSGLYTLYAQIFPEPVIGPVLGVSSLVLLFALLLMFWMLIKHPKTTRDH